MTSRTHTPAVQRHSPGKRGSFWKWSLFLLLLVLMGGGIWFLLAVVFVDPECSDDCNGSPGMLDSDQASDYGDRPIISSPVSVAVLSVTDNSGLGTLNVTPNVSGSGYTLDLTANLPALPDRSEEYEVWIVKKGLADVKKVGTLSMRADGSHGGRFTIDPTGGVAEPSEFEALFVIRALVSGSSGPDGVKVAKANW